MESEEKNNAFKKNFITLFLKEILLPWQIKTNKIINRTNDN